MVSFAWGQRIIISEFMASNQTGLMDEDGDPSDWIEIYNTSHEQVLLSGWFLTDEASNRTKWEFPAFTIPAKSSIIVFASGKDRTDPGSELHTNFKLSKSGEYLGITHPDGRTVSHAYGPSYPVQLTDVSYGIGMQVETTPFIENNSSGKLLFPSDNALGKTWTQPEYNDELWKGVTLGVGYLRDGAGKDPGASPGDPLGLTDLTSPGDSIEPSSFHSPTDESAPNAIDNNPETKYLNFDKLNAGFTVKISRGPATVTGIRLTSANDVPNRDPSEYVLLGSNNGSAFREISKGAVPSFKDRFETVEIQFNNESAFTFYRLLFPSVRNAAAAVAMQIAEVELLGLISGTEPGEPEGVDLTLLKDVSAPEDKIDPTTFNSPANEDVRQAIDNDPQTKYLNFDGESSGFTIQPAIGPTIINGLRLTSANDAQGRDPSSYRLEGLSEENVFKLISAGSVPSFEDRFSEVEIAFANDTSYEVYRLVFPTLRGGSTQLMQIAEVEFLGNTGLSQPDMRAFIQTNLESAMYGNHSSVYLRMPFSIDPTSNIQDLTMPIRYNDGFIAYLNGVEVARANAPTIPDFDSVATEGLSDGFLYADERINLPSFAHLLTEKENILAIHALNDTPSSPSFLLDVQLENSTTHLDLSTAVFFDEPSPGAPNSGEHYAGKIPAPLISPKSGFKKAGFDVSIQSETNGAKIYYSLDGSEPSEISGTEYVRPFRVNKTTVLRAITVLDGWKPSPVATRSYLFTRDIVQQFDMSGLDAAFPSRWGSQLADYGLDARVVGKNGRDHYDGKYAESFQDDLTSIPSISLVMASEDLFGPKGIYAYPTSRGDAWDNWERPVSVELIYPDERDGFQENAGVKIQGGAFRRFDLTMKKSFRLVFRGKYGTTKLNFPLFGPDATDAFDTVVLRANGNDAWKYAGSHALYFRDAFAMETARDMGMVSSHTTFAHLYLNGAYWGLYNLVERPDASFSASYHGGDKDDWDALNQDSVPDGTREAWDRMLSMLNEAAEQDEIFQMIQGKNPDGIRDPSLENLLDIENLIDYCILNFYIGNQDWPGRNYWVGRDREGTEGFQFYPWDSETALGFASGLNANRTGVRTAVARPYGALRANATFRRWFGDRVQHHFFQGGALYVNPGNSEWSEEKPEDNHPAARFARLAEQIDSAIVGETARWGDQLSGQPFTRDEHWRRERDRLLNTYFPHRTAVVLEQLRRAGLYPRVKAPAFNLPGGNVEQGASLSMSTTGGTIYYTLDGTDPRTEVKIQTVLPSTLVDANTQKRVMIPGSENAGKEFGEDWYLQSGFPDKHWIHGKGGVGYDTGTGYQSLIQMDVRETMNGKNGSAYIRIPFEVTSETMDTSNFMILRMRYDDGFVAYLNGERIASANAPEDLEWNSFATMGNDDSNALFWEEFESTMFLEHLRPGENLLAIQGLNVSLASTDFLIDVELMVGHRNLTGNLPTANHYTSPIELEDLTTIKAATLSGSEWSALNEATFIVGDPQLIVSELHYHPVDSTSEEILAGFDDEDAFEFIELYNPGDVSFPLEGVRFVDGIDFNFADSHITRLAPGNVVLIVKDRSAFELRYGQGLPVAGEYSGSFSNSGETVEIVDANDQTLIAFSYDDQMERLKDADGRGASLITHFINGDPNQEAHWITSDRLGGSPGTVWELTTEADILPTIMLKGDKVLIECRVPISGDYGLYGINDLRVSEWDLLLTQEELIFDEKIGFEVDVSHSTLMRFFQIRKISNTP